MDLTETAVFRIGVKQVDRLFTHAHLDFAAATIATVLLVTSALFNKVNPTVVIACVLPMFFAVVRFAIALSYNRKTRASAAVKRWELFFNLATTLAGATWGALAAYLIFDAQASGGSAALGICAFLSLAGVVLYAGSFVITLIYAGLALAPAALAGIARGDELGVSFAIFAVGAFAIAVLCARIIKRSTWELVMAQTENEQMLGHLDQRRTQVEKLNVALKTNADKREQAEITLRRTAADLGLVQGKAKALADTLERVSPMCQVTGLANRKHFEAQLDSEWRRATREKKPMSLVIVEIDEFELYGEHYGSQSSDNLLKRVGQTMKGFGRRSGDLAARYEEEKIALILPSCDARNAARMAAAARKRIEATKIAHAGAKNREIVTVHVGVATIKPSRGLSPAELSKRTEAALYEARFQGGNKVVHYKPLSKLKLERWNQPNDGPLNEQSLIQKLLVWGYDTSRDIMPPGSEAVTHSSPNETVIAILTGEMLIDVEGHTMAIKPGDSIFVPGNVVLQLQASGEHPVLRFTATKSK